MTEHDANRVPDYGEPEYEFGEGWERLYAEPPKPVYLSRGAHERRFDADGNASVCAMEFLAYVANEPHSDSPKCVSPVLVRFVTRFNDDLPDVERQRLRPYLARMIGTAGDGQDRAREYMALDWLVRTHTSAFLAAAGLEEEADALRGLAAIEGAETCRAATPAINAARAAARDAVWDAAWDAARDAARDAVWAAVWAAAGAAAWDADGGDPFKATRAALRPTEIAVRESAFELLGRLIDPAGIHDVPSRELLERDAAGLVAP